MKLGILGGSFAPPHWGHIILAEAALRQLGLNEVWLMPCAIPPHKPLAADFPPERRLELCRLAARFHYGIEVSALEIGRGGVSYTADTVRSLRQHDLTLIMGGDMALSFPSWMNALFIANNCRIAVAPRGEQRAAIAEKIDCVFLDVPYSKVSSTQIRELMAANAFFDDLVPPAVARALR